MSENIENGYISDDEYNTFSADVELGGLRNTAQIRILLCFVVKNLDGKISRSKLIDVIRTHGIANYFDLSQSLEELIKSGNLTADSEELLSITPKGTAAVDELINEIPKTIREKAISDAVKLLTIERRENENKVIVKQLENGFDVSFTVSNGDDVLMKLSIYAADEYQVEKIKSNYLNDPISIYAGIVSKLFS